MDQSLVHTFSWGTSYGPMVLKVLLKFPPTLALVHGWLFPEMTKISQIPEVDNFRKQSAFSYQNSTSNTVPIAFVAIDSVVCDASFSSCHVCNKCESKLFFKHSSEENRRATTNVQNGLVIFFLFSLRFLKNSEKCENVRKSAKKCEKVPRRFCPLVVAL